jgi:hypothetical protein
VGAGDFLGRPTAGAQASPVVLPAAPSRPRRRRRLTLTLACALLPLLWPAAAQAQLAQVTNPSRGCAGDVGSIGNCAAGELGVNVRDVQIAGDPTACARGQILTVESATVEYAITAAARYNLLLWLGLEEGTDPRATTAANQGGQCYVSSLPGPYVSPFVDIDRTDRCADMTNRPPRGSQTYRNIDVECQDNDGDGSADLRILVTWQQNSTGNCGAGAADDPIFPVGAPSKCSYEEGINLGVPVVEPATLTVVKNSLGADEAFDFSWGSSGNPAASFTLDTSTGPETASRTFQITEGLGDTDFAVAEVLTQAQLAAGWSFASARCVDDGGNPIGTFDDGGGSDNFRAIVGMTLDEGDDVTCTFTNAAPARLTVVKKSIDGTANFQIFNDVPGLGSPTPGALLPYLLQLDTTPTGTAQETASGIRIADPVNGDDFTLTEVPPNIPGTGDIWTLVSAVCDNGDFSETTTLGVNLKPGDDVTCTFTNALNASVSIVKDTVGGDGSFDFETTLSGTGITSGRFGITTSNDSGAFVLADPVSPGTYTVKELVPPGWDLTSLRCEESKTQNSSTDLSTATATLLLEAGEVVTCTFVDRRRGTIEIEKATAPAGNQTFLFTSDIPNASSFITQAGNTTTFADLEPGQYRVTEDDPSALVPDAFDLTGLDCVDSDAAGTDSSGDLSTRTATINLDPGETVTCTYTNTAQGSIRIRKEVTADGPADRVFDFSGDLGVFSLGPVAVGAPEEITVGGLAPGTYKVFESDPTADGWALVSETCTDGSSPLTGIDLAAGEDVTCTFINAPLGSASVIKATVGGDGDFELQWGTQANGAVPENEPDIFRLTTASGTATKDFSFSLLPDDPYDLTETVLPPPVGPYDQQWRLTGVQCREDVRTDSIFNPGENGADATLVAQSGETVACTFQNSLDGTLVIRKETLPDGIDEAFTFTGDVAGPIRDHSTFNEEIFASAAPGTTLTSAETVPAGYSLTGIACTGAVNSTVTIGTDADFDAGDDAVAVTVKSGETVVCTFTNEKEGSITIVKQTAGGDGRFAFGGDLGGFDIDTAVDADEAFTGLLTGTYRVSETVAPGWALSNIACSGDNVSSVTIGASGGFDPGDTGVAIDLRDGEDIVCTFTNERYGRIRVAKETDPDGSSQSFDFVGAVSATIGDGDQSPWVDLPPGEYQARELVPAGWDLTVVGCDDADSTGDLAQATATFRVQPAEEVTCTFENRIQRGRILVDKVADPPGSTSFDFTLSGAGVNQSFSLTDAAPPHDSGDLLPSSENGGYSVAESVPPDWRLLIATCDDGSPVDAIDLDPGETVTCTFQNAIEPGRIIVDKVTDPVGSAQLFDFTLSGGGASRTFQLTGTGVPFDSGELTPGSYSLTETLPPGWDRVGASCDNGDDPGSIDLGPDQTVICTFTNRIRPGRILVDKVTDPQGSTQSFDFTLSGAGVSQTFPLTDAAAPHDSGDLLPTSENGTYSVAEAVTPGWDLTSARCTDGSDLSAIDLSPGETVTCTVTNAIQRGRILVDKATDPSGSSQPFDIALSGTNVSQTFSLTDAAAPHDSGGLLPSLENGPYSIAETDLPGWDLTSADCSNGDGADAVTLAPGQTVACELVNRIRRGRILVDKVTNPPGSLQSFDFALSGTSVSQSFSLTDAAAPHDSGELLPTSENGPYDIAEADVQGWELTSATCDDGSGAGAVALEPGETVTCTFLNTESQGPTKPPTTPATPVPTNQLWALLLLMLSILGIAWYFRPARH